MAAPARNLKVILDYIPNHSSHRHPWLVSRIGAPTLYYGDEIGMEDVPIPPERVQDPWEKHVPGLRLGRDPQGTPMQWDDTPNAGFSTWEIIEGFKARVTCSAIYVTIGDSALRLH